MSVPLSYQNPDVLIQPKKKNPNVLFLIYLYCALDCDDFYCNCFDY